MRRDAPGEKSLFFKAHEAFFDVRDKTPQFQSEGRKWTVFATAKCGTPCEKNLGRWRIFKCLVGSGSASNSAIGVAASNVRASLNVQLPKKFKPRPASFKSNGAARVFRYGHLQFAEPIDQDLVPEHSFGLATTRRRRIFGP